MKIALHHNYTPLFLAVDGSSQYTTASVAPSKLQAVSLPLLTTAYSPPKAAKAWATIRSHTPGSTFSGSIHLSSRYIPVLV